MTATAATTAARTTTTAPAPGTPTTRASAAAAAGPAHGLWTVLRIPFLVHRWLQILGQQFQLHRAHGNLVGDVGLDLWQGHGVFLAAEADGVALRAGACRAADAMHVIRGILRQVEIEDMADVGNVQAA